MLKILLLLLLAFAASCVQTETEAEDRATVDDVDQCPGFFEDSVSSKTGLVNCNPIGAGATCKECGHGATFNCCPDGWTCVILCNTWVDTFDRFGNRTSHACQES